MAKDVSQKGMYSHRDRSVSQTHRFLPFEETDMQAGEELRRYLNMHPPQEVAEQIRSGFVSSELEKMLKPLRPLVKKEQRLYLNEDVELAVYHYFSQKKK